jgi:MAE_28990/MAE_18760-like HEPN
MSSNFFNDFIDRKKQLRRYVSVVATAERLFDRSTISRVQENRLMTLRSGTFLVLYNLIESSVRLAIESIHDQVVREHVEFQKLNPTMRREVLRLFRLDSKSKLHENPVNFPSALVAAALGQEFRLRA